MKKKLILIGNTAFAQIAYEYFTFDSNYEVVAFSVEKEFINEKILFELPVVAFEELETLYKPEEHFFYAAITYTQLNRLRTRLFNSAKNKGYSPASYISSKAFCWKNVKLAEHIFVFENNVIQPFSEIEENVVLWSGNHIGHHSIVRKNSFISSHVVVSGFCEIGESCFIGVNAAIGNNLKIGNDSILGAGTVITKDTEVGKIYTGNPGLVAKVSSYQYFQINKI